MVFMQWCLLYPNQATNILEQTAESLRVSLLISCSPLIFTPVHNQTVLCPVPPYGPSTMMPACCCRDLTRYEHSEPPERAAAARGGQRNTGLFLVRGVLPRAAAPSVPWGTRAKQERRDHSLQPSSLCRSSWKRGNVLKLESVCCVNFISQSEAMGDGMDLQGHLCYWVWFLNPEGDHILKSGRCQPRCFPLTTGQRNCSCRNNMRQITSAN